MPTTADAVESIVERARADAGGDFAFVLSMMGRLVTQRAPRDMPEPGRLRLVQEARALVGTHHVALVSMPREELVPYGGAAPIDVYVGAAAEHAIVCVVMASWADQASSPVAVAAALEALEALLARGAKKPSRAKRKDRATSRPPMKSETRPSTSALAAALAEPPAASAASSSTGSKGSDALPVAPRRRGAMTGLVSLTGAVARASTKLKASPTIASAPPPAPSLLGRGSMPSILVGEAELGRETLLAVEAEQRQNAMPPTGARGGSTPDVRVELASIGRATQLELRAEEARRMQSLVDASAEDAVLGPAVPRATQPWVELPVDTKRAVDASTTGRKAAPPKVTLKLEEPDAEDLEALLAADLEEEAGEATPAEEAPRPPKPSLDVWHDALADAIDPSKKKA
jgi:hypothetical protein